MNNYWIALAFCGLATANHFILHGGHFSTEDGKLFSASFVHSRDAERITAQGCEIQCADSCQSHDMGSFLIQCYSSCGCSFLIAEIQQKPIEEFIAAYNRDLSIEITEPEKGERSLDFKITGSVEPITVKYPKTTQISYETDETEEELEIKVTNFNGKSSSEFELNHNYTQSQNVEDDFYQWSVTNNNWNGQAHERTEYAQEHFESKLGYQIPAQGISGEAVRKFTMHTKQTTGQMIGRFSSDYNSTTKSGTTEDFIDIEYILTTYNVTDSSYNQTDVLYSQTGVLYSQTGVLYNQTDVSYNQTDVSYNQTDVSYDKTDVIYNQTDVSYDQTDVSYNQTDITSNQTATVPAPPLLQSLDGGYDYDINISWSSLSVNSTNLVSLPAEESLFSYIVSLLLKILFLALFILGVVLLFRMHILSKLQHQSEELPEPFYIRL